MAGSRVAAKHSQTLRTAEGLGALIESNERLQLHLSELIHERDRWHEERRWLMAMINQVPDYLFVKDIKHRFVIANVAVSADLGYPDPKSLIGLTDRELHTPERARRFMRDEQQVLRRGKPLIDIEEYVTRPDGTRRWLLTSKLPLRDDKGRIIGLVGIARDITERRQTEEREHFLAYHDPLTQLPNRAEFEGELRRAVDRAADGVPLALLLLDLDRLKHVNGTLGRLAGDELLRQVANRLSQLVGPAGAVARLGGDEFAVLLAGPAAKAATSMGDAIAVQLGREFSLFGDPAFITASIGVAPWHAGVGADELMRQVDIALQAAKAGGGGRWQLFSPLFAKSLDERRRIERDLRSALAGDHQLALEYQPIFSADGQRVLGAEALVRWDHPTRGRLSPEAFVNVAEERGLIGKLGEWVLEETCGTLAATRVPWIAVNVSPVQFRDRSFFDHVLARLAAHGISSHRLQIEITEGVLLDATRETEEGLAQLREAGIRLALDDFGTGYSSLNYLRRYNIDKLKVDQSFVSRLGETADAQVIVTAIVALARSLGMRITAEGVSTERQREILVGMGCDELQGFLLSRPLRLQDFKALLEEGAETRAKA